MKLILKIKDKEYAVEIIEEENGVKIKVDGKEFAFGEEEGEEKILAFRTSLPKRDFSKKEIKTPIAGTISEVFVENGEFVKKNQRVLTLSSMKMENEIVSDFEGKVKGVLVKKGKDVKEGDILIILG